MRQISSLLLIVLIFSGTVGVQVFRHHCPKDGMEISYLLPSEDPCKAKEKESCCSESGAEEKHCSEAESEEHDFCMEDPCCVQDMLVYKLAADFELNEGGQAEDVVTTFIAIPVLDQDKSELVYDQRPVIPFLREHQFFRTGRSILIAHQVFRI
ncbi:MAG: hypothetical protein EP338_05700 [Bacteroidetes bacterium]|nr:MAG: hypothetical protein EP338_05700 [Bacteroidota bacterium]